MNLGNFSTEKGVVLYQSYNIIRKMTICSLIEYTNIYGMKKVAIIHNDFNKIIYYAENFKDYRISNTLENYENLFSQIKKSKTIQLVGEFQLNSKEYFTNFPYKLQINAKKNSLAVNIDANISNAIILIQKRTDIQYRMIRFRHKEIEVYGKLGIVYQINEEYGNLIDLAHEIKFDKNGYYYKSHNTIDSKLDDCIVREGDEASKKNKRKYEKKNSKVISYKIDDEKMESSSLENKFEEINSIKNTILNLKPELNSNHGDLNNLSNYSDLIDKPQIINKKSLGTQKTYEYNNFNILNKMGNLEPEKKQRLFNVTNRNLTLVRYLKNLYKNSCQICGESIEISNNQFLCEVHHIKPLGLHNGADVIENMLVLCPNHHVMFDRGAITINVENKTVIHFNQTNQLNNKNIELKHEINGIYIDYHNNNILINSIVNLDEVLYDSNCGDIEDAQVVDYGNIVTLQDIETKESFNVKIENKFNKNFMKNIEKLLVNRVLDDVINYDEFKYKIIDIVKRH